jgi:hypothetical protein
VIVRGLGLLPRSLNPGRRWLALKTLTLVREALQGALDGLARKPPVVGALAAGRVKDGLAVLPNQKAALEGRLHPARKRGRPQETPGCEAGREQA